MFHVHLKRICIMLLWEKSMCIYIYIHTLIHTETFNRLIDIYLTYICICIYNLLSIFDLGHCLKTQYHYILVDVCLEDLSIFYCCSITFVCIFSPPVHSTPAKSTSLPCFPPPPWFCPCVLYSSFWKPISPLPPPHYPLAIVRLFLTSMSLVIFCLLFSFVD